MKKHIILTYIVTGLCNISIAQTTFNTCPPATKTEAEQNQTCQDGKGITTNPSNPVNTECPILINNFDWKLKQPISNTIIEEVYSVYDADNIYRTIRNPFDDNTNSDYRYLALKQNSNYYPEDGWELLKVDFATLGNIGLGINVDPGRNTDVTGPRLPYMILYNKYSGTFRFFGSLLGQMDGYETIRIQLRIPERSPGDQSSDNVYESDLKATNLLSIQGDAVQPLDQETDENVLVVFAKATNNSNKFFWFDIPVAYDPCLCNIRSQLDITFAFVQTASINLNGVIDGALTTGNKANGSPKGVKVATTVIAAGISTVLAVKTGGAVINFQAYSDLVKLFKDIPGLSSAQKDNLDELSNYVDCGLKFAKVIKNDFKDVSASGTLTEAQKKAKYKAANNILDANTTFLSSITNGCAKMDNGATTINATANLSGTWTEEQTVQGTEIKLAIPGSKWDDRKRFIRSHTDTENDKKTIPAYPTYNERLGTFALLETPTLKVTRKKEVSEMEEKTVPFEIIESFNVVTRIDPQSIIKYVFNPKMNVDLEKTVILVRYAVKQSLHMDEDGSNLFGYHIPNHNLRLNTGSQYPITSPFVPLDNYKNMAPLIFSTKKRFSSSGNNNNLFFNMDDSLFIQFKISMVSKDLGKDGKNNSAVYFYTYPVNVDYEYVDDPEPRDYPTYPEYIHDSVDFQAQLQAYYKLHNEVYLLKLQDKAQNAGNFLTDKPEIRDAFRDFDQDIVFAEDEIMVYEGLVTINAKLSTAAGKKVKIYSVMGFEIEPDAEIGPDIELIVGHPYEVYPMPPQTYTEVSNFCANTNKYKAQEFSEPAMQAEAAEYERRRQALDEMERKQKNKTIDFKVYPNPATEIITVSFDKDLESNVDLFLLDLTGRTISTQRLAAGHKNHTVSLQNLAKGMYMISVVQGDSKTTKKVVVQ